MYEGIKKAIIAVDDETLVLVALRMKLQRHYGKEYEIDTATSAEAAERLLDELIADGVHVILILSDWAMPGMRGDELFERIRSRHPDIKCILLSGYACDDRVERLYAIKCLDAFVSKPWTEESLFGTIDRLIEV